MTDHFNVIGFYIPRWGLERPISGLTKKKKGILNIVGNPSGYKTRSDT